MFFMNSLNNQFRDSLIVIGNFVNACVRRIIWYYRFVNYGK